MWSPSRLNLRTTTFLIYINDLNYALKFSSASHFADDTSIIYTSKNLKTLETNINFDLKSVSEWLKSNRLPLMWGKPSYYFSDLNVVRSNLRTFLLKSKVSNYPLVNMSNTWVFSLTKISLGITT